MVMLLLVGPRSSLQHLAYALRVVNSAFARCSACSEAMDAAIKISCEQLEGGEIAQLTNDAAS
jgi:hypothetical protein